MFRNRSRPERVKALIWLVALAPIVCALLVMVTHWVPVPWWDEWQTPGAQIASYYRGALSFQELCSQHNESRKLFPRLVYLPLALFAGWDVRASMALTFAFVCAGSALLYLLARRSCGSPVAAGACYAAMNVWLFWPRQYENFLLGIQGELFVPGFAIAAACLINLSPWPLWRKAVANALLAHLSTYTVANGMLVWPLAFPIAAFAARENAAPAKGQRNQILARVGYVGAGAVSIGCYFSGYRHPPLSPPLVFEIRRWPELLGFVARWLGDITMTEPLAAGLLIVLLFAALAGAAVVLSRSNGQWQHHYSFILLGCYTLLSGCITAVGRLGFGSAAAAHFRYAPFTAFLYIAVAGLAGSIYRQFEVGSPVAKQWRTGCVIAAVAVAALGFNAARKERRVVNHLTADRDHLRLAVRWSEAIPKNPDLARLSPYENTPATIRTLAEHDALRPRLVGAELARIVAKSPASVSDAAGRLEVRPGAKAGEFEFKGWAYADCVVIGYETAEREWRLLTVVETRKKRRDVAAQFPDGPIARPKFSHALKAVDLPPGDNTYRAWGIDLAAEGAWPLGGAVRLPGETR